MQLYIDLPINLPISLNVRNKIYPTLSDVGPKYILNISEINKHIKAVTVMPIAYFLVNIISLTNYVAFSSDKKK